jgi:hypothetical protein
LDLEANCQILGRQIENDLEDREEFVGLIETPYRNVMLDRRIMQIDERLVGNRLFLPQEVV